MSLQELVDRFGPLPPPRAVHFLRQVCGALAEAHEAGLIHRDVKPANIFAAERGGLHDFAKLLDFGLVRDTKPTNSPKLTGVFTLAGTPYYMSPEQAAVDRDADARSDIYSLGGVAHFLLTGRPPFEAQSASAVLVAHAGKDVEPPSQLRPEIPKDVEQVVLRCLAKTPEERFQSALAMERALAACDGGDWTREAADQWWSHQDRILDHPATH